MTRFERDDMEIGELIAYGSFSHVHEVLSFRGESSLPEKRYVLKNLNPKLAFNPGKQMALLDLWEIFQIALQTIGCQ
jgi:hypothetical protein